VTAEQAQDLSAVPSFAVENVEEKSPKQKSRKWWQFYVNDKESQESSSSSEVRLVDMNILSWSYLIGGSIESLAGFAGFFWVFYRYGIGFQSLWGMAREGNAYSTLEPMDSVISGREYSGEQLKSYLAEAQTAYFMSIVIVQFFVLLVKKVDIGYPWGSQMLLNKFTYYAFIPSLGFALFCAYVPFMNEILLTGYLHIEGYIPAIIAGIVIFVIEFIRKANKKEQKEAKKHDEENPVTVNILKDSLLKHSAHSFEKQQHLRRSLNMNKAMKVG
jgi:magnesium-transporting ATPase (P-type)